MPDINKVLIEMDIKHLEYLIDVLEKRSTDLHKEIIILQDEQNYNTMNFSSFNETNTKIEKLMAERIRLSYIITVFKSVQDDYYGD